MNLSKIINYIFRRKPKEIIKKDKKPEVIVVSTNKELEDKYEELNQSREN